MSSIPDSKCKKYSESRYVVLKVYVLGRDREHELNIYNYMNTIETDHPGRMFIRRLFEHFFVDGPNGRHVCLVHELLGFRAVDFLRYLPGKKMSIEGMKPAIRHVLMVLDFLHSVAGVVYTGTYCLSFPGRFLKCRMMESNQIDLQLKNLLLPTPSPDALSAFEEREIKTPTARKVLEDRAIYITSRAPTGNGFPLVSDFGEARFDDEECNQDIMPDCYRAPEVILKSSWDYKVDIWSVAMIVRSLRSPNDPAYLVKTHIFMYPRPEEEITDGVFRVFHNSDQMLCLFKIINRPFYQPHDTKFIQKELENLEYFRGVPGIVQAIGIVVSTNPYMTSKRSTEPPVVIDILLEHYPGGSLKQVLDKNNVNKYPWDRRAAQIRTALYRFHRAGKTHMNIKPSSIMLDAERNVVLIDISGIGGVTHA